jgi:exosortase K
MRSIKPGKISAGVLKNGILYVGVLLVVLGLKTHYSRAGSDGLGWVLSPTAQMVETISGIRFEKEDGTGYVSRRCRVIIAPSCAGVNFLIIVFCMTAFTGLPLLKNTRSKVFYLSAGMAGAYLLTIVVNAFRIVISIHTFRADISRVGWTPEKIHRIEGIFVYFFFLSLFYLVLRKIVRHRIRGKQTETKNRSGTPFGYRQMFRASCVPLLWYILICIGMPLLNGAWQRSGSQFIEHCRTVLSVSAVVFLSVFLIQLCYRRIADNIL